MDSPDAARRLTQRTAGFAIAGILLILGVFAVLYDRQARSAWRQESRSAASGRLNLLASDLQGRIDADMQLVRGLVAVVSAEPDLDAARFHRIGTELLSGRDEAQMITAAPDLVVSMAYPEAIGRGAIGFDFRSIPSDPDLLQPGGHRIGLFGPTLSHQGNDILSARAGVFTGEDQALWGMVSLVIDAQALFRAAGFADQALPVDVAVVNPSALGTERTIHGDPRIFEADPVRTMVRTPNGGWLLAAVPRGGWPTPPSLWLGRMIFALTAAVLTGFILAVARMIISRQQQLALIRTREAELSKLSWRLEFALASSNVGVWDVDLATDRLIWDPRTKALFGREGDDRDYYGLEDWVAIIHPDDRERAIAEAEAATAGDGRFSSLYRVMLPNGELRHIRDVARVHTAADGSQRLVGLVWDVTEEVGRQEELELRRVEAEAATTAKSRFLASMSHEIRTPMSGVLGVLGLMLDDTLPQVQRERAKIALDSAESLLAILNDILDFSKLEAEEVALGEEPVDIRALVTQVIDLMSPNAISKGLLLRHVISASVPRYVLGDAVRIRQILTNFLSNATKFTDRGEIAVRVNYGGGIGAATLSIEVEDTGIGIAPEHQENIFHRFIQADDSLTRRAGGTGLGLAISSQLAELMGGRVSVRSVAGMGSTFRVEVPAPATAPQRAVGEEPADADELPPMRLLLAEDHATNQYVITAFLRAAGHEVTVVTNGAEAVRAAREGGLDAMLMDLQMPVMDGLAAARAIRALDGPAAAVPILALTASAMPGDREACLAAGMNGHLTKPITAATLNAALRAMRGAAEPGEEAPQPRCAATS
jgi:signal transduction histidine kinase/CheY-like chemotaxis protein